MRSRSMWRGSLVLAVALLAAGVLATSPAGSAARALTKAKALKLFYTKAQADAKFIDTTEKAADADKLDGLDSGAFLGAGAKAADADKIDGIDSASLARKLDNVVTVSASGGDFTSIQAAIDSITDESGSNPYLVLVGPGSYPGRVTMANNINLQGSGEATRLTAGGASTCTDAFTLRGATAVVRDVFIGNTGGAVCSLGVLNPASSSSVYDHVVIFSLGGTSTAIGMRNDDPSQVIVTDSSLEGTSITPGGDGIGIDNLGTFNLTLRRSRVIGGGPDKAWALNNDLTSANATVEESELFAFDGTERIAIRNVVSGFVNVRGSLVDGFTNTISTVAGYTTRVATSRLAGGPVIGTVTCYAVYDENFTGPGLLSCPS